MDADQDACRVQPPQHETDVSALRWLDRNHPDLLAVARRCLSAGSPQAWRLIHNLECYQRMRDFYSEIIVLNTEALRLAEQAGDLLGQAAMHQNLGLVDMRTSRYRAALTRFRTALRLYTQAGNADGLATIHHELCNVNKWLDDLPQARVHATYCFEVAFSGGDLTRQAFALSTLGTLDRLEGHHTAAAAVSPGRWPCSSRPGSAAASASATASSACWTSSKAATRTPKPTSARPIPFTSSSTRKTTPNPPTHCPGDQLQGRQMTYSVPLAELVALTSQPRGSLVTPKTGRLW
ncbi:tetratricopeptide repeat protein [Nonomuraea sp. NPDC049607]|uniref:tetratricopeptide repeat protein n=1 Tax=Nonomuraea sp. NPDC049607 TaxID=3154732 RepID=UPI00342A02FE